MVKDIIILSVLALVGCATLPTDSPPLWQDHSERYILSGRQGWMPGQHLTFGHYQVVRHTHQPFHLLDDVLLKIRHQSVTLHVVDHDDNTNTARFHFEQRCDGGHGSLTIVEPNKFVARLDVQGQHVTFTDPDQFVWNGQHYQLDYGAADWPRVITITRNREVLAELHLGVYDGSFSAKDHLWLRKNLTRADAMLSALLVGYAATYDPDYCDKSEDE